MLHFGARPFPVGFALPLVRAKFLARADDLVYAKPMAHAMPLVFAKSQVHAP